MRPPNSASSSPSFSDSRASSRMSSHELPADRLQVRAHAVEVDRRSGYEKDLWRRFVHAPHASEPLGRKALSPVVADCGSGERGGEPANFPAAAGREGYRAGMKRLLDLVARYAHDRSVLNPTDQVVTARPKGPSGMRHRTLIATSVIAVAVVLLLAACGGSSSGPRVAHSGGAASPAAGSGSVGPGSPDFTARLVKYAACMREHGVPNFPDPNANEGFAIPIDRSSPAWVAAQATCRKLMPGGGPPARGSATHPSATALASAAEGVAVHASPRHPRLPRPWFSYATQPPARGVITDMSGVILVFPSALAMRSPAFAQAEAACNLGIRPPA